jgi:hypothetical protein
VYLIDRIVDAAAAISFRHAVCPFARPLVRGDRCVEAEGGGQFNIFTAVKNHFPRPGHVK